MRVPPDQSFGRSGGAVERAVGIAAGELPGDAREPGAEHERLDAPAGRHAGLHVLEQHARVRLHRAGHVAHQDERPGALGRLAPVALHRVAAGAERGADRAAQVGARGVRRRTAAAGRARAAARARAGPRAARRRISRRASCALGVGVVGEVLLAQELGVRPRGRHDIRLALGGHRPPPRPARRRAAAPARPPRAPRAGRAPRGPAARTARRRRRRRRRSRHGASTTWPSARSRRRCGRPDRRPRARDAHGSARPRPRVRLRLSSMPQEETSRAGDPEARSRSRTLQHLALADAVDVLAHLQDDAERLVEVALVEREQRLRPRDRLADARAACRAPRRAGARPPRTRGAAISSGTPGRRAWTISASRSGSG